MSDFENFSRMGLSQLTITKTLESSALSFSLDSLIYGISVEN